MQWVYLYRPTAHQQTLAVPSIPLHAGNSSLPLFIGHKSIKRKQVRGDTSTIRGKQRNNRNTELHQKQKPTYIHRNGFLPYSRLGSNIFAHEYYALECDCKTIRYQLVLYTFWTYRLSSTVICPNFAQT